MMIDSGMVLKFALFRHITARMWRKHKTKNYLYYKINSITME